MFNRRVSVTGAGGFIGSHLVEELLRRGAEVSAFIRYTSHGSMGWLDKLPAELRDGLEVFYGDIRDARAVREAMRDCGMIFHLAALIGIPYSYLAPRSYVEVNIQGTLNVLEAARDLEVARTVITSTSEVYGTAVYTPIDEEHPLQSQSPYAATKVAADQLALSYCRSFDLPIVVVRPFNTYGPRQSARAVIPTIITQALTRKCIKVGNLKPVRDFVFVKDTVEGFIALATSDACVGKVTNLATGTSISIGQLAETITQLTDRNIPIAQEEKRFRPEQSEVFELLGSADSAMQRAGWKARTSLEAGLAQTLTWIKANLEQYKIGTYHR